MIVSDVLDLYKAESGYVTNSMINKSYDDYGATYKWLHISDPINNKAVRREIFIATSGTGTLEERTVLTYIEVIDAR